MDLTNYLQLGLALILVLALMGLLSVILKKVNAYQSGLAGKSNRLKIVEQRMIDAKHKAVILRCDDKEHLVIISQSGKTVCVEAGMTPPKDSKKDIRVEGF